jgi:hypothetical protein
MLRRLELSNTMSVHSPDFSDTLYANSADRHYRPDRHDSGHLDRAGSGHRLTARYALSPTVQALAKAFESRGSDETIRILERRIDLQEQEMAGLRAAVQGVEDAHDFERKLSAPPALPPSAEG